MKASEGEKGLGWVSGEAGGINEVLVVNQSDRELEDAAPPHAQRRRWVQLAAEGRRRLGWL